MGINISEEIIQISCEHGHLDVAKWLLYRGVKTDLNNLFKIVCKKGNVKMAEWIYSLKKIGKKCLKEIFEKSFYINKYEIVDWIYSLNILDISDIENIFQKFCKNGLLEKAKYMYLLIKSINIHINDDYLFKNSPKNIIKWLKSL